MRSVGSWATALLLVCLGVSSAADEASARVIVTIVGFESDAGHVRVALWDSAEGFPTGENYVAAMNVDIEGETARLEFADIALGSYALSVFHDENDNGELDSGFMGRPKEPIGASNDARGRFGPPKYKDARFEVDQAVVELTINLQQP